LFRGPETARGAFKINHRKNFRHLLLILTEVYEVLNDELDELIRHKNIINYIKAQRLSWFGHVHRMPEERMVKKKGI